MGRFPRVYSVLLWFIAGSSLFAADAASVPVATPSLASASYTLREWHEQDGLPSDELVAVTPDRDGYLWVAADGELARFDGTIFERHRLPFQIYPRAMARAHGTIVMPATRTGEKTQTGLAVLRNNTWNFEREESLEGKSPARSVCAAPDGAFWFGCEDGTVVRRNGDNVVVFESPTDASGKKTTPVFATDSDGRVWILRGNRLSRAEGSTLMEIPLPWPEPELRLASSAIGGIWVFTRTALLRWNGTALEETLRLPELAGAHFVQAIHEDTRGYLWVGTRSQGLFRIKDRAIESVATSSEDVTAITEDADGNLWAATNGGGLSRVRSKAHQLFDQSSGLKDNFSFTVAEDPTGAIWLANRDGGMARIKDGVVDPISRRAGWRAFSTMSVYPAPDGSIWMTTGLGVYRTTAAAPQMATRVRTLSELRNVRATFVAKNGDYWLADDPVRVARWRDDQVTTFTAKEGFEGHEVRAFAEDDTGRIWLGAADGKLFHSNGDARFERVTFPYNEDCGALQVIRFEPDGTLMVGTTRRGVLIFPQGDFSRPRSLDESRGLSSNNVSQILVDDYDRTWFASRGGIFWVHGKEVRDFAAGTVDRVHSIILGKDDGVPYLSCLGLFQPAAWKARDGTLWFATRRGVLRTDPALMGAANQSPPTVTVTSIVCDGVSQPLGAELRIPSSVRKIQLRLSALNLSAPESVQVRFHLDGFDSDWVVLGRDHVVTYPRLPVGRYGFSTMASIGSGSWSSQPAQLTVIVSPPWWQTDWARFGYLLALVTVVVAVVRKWAHRRLRLRLERAEHARAIEHERARIARNIHDDVGASLARISLLTQSAQQESPVHSPTLEKIYEATHAITRSMDEIVWAVNPRHDNTESLVYYLGNFAQSLLGAAGIRCRLESADHMPDVTLTSQIRHHLFLCCKEALHNVVKHAHASEATVRISIDDGTLVICISDNGRGLATVAATEAGASDSRAVKGNGQRNMQHRMGEIGGSCAIIANATGGTQVIFTVPLRLAQAV